MKHFVPPPPFKTPPLTLQPMPRSRRYIVVYDTQIRGHVVPNGYQTDGASIPRPFWFVVGSPFSPDVIRAAMLHDFLYSHRKVSRIDADDLLYEVMIADGVPRWRALVIHVAVRAVGWLFW